MKYKLVLIPITDRKAVKGDVIKLLIDMPNFTIGELSIAEHNYHGEHWQPQQVVLTGEGTLKHNGYFLDEYTNEICKYVKDPQDGDGIGNKIIAIYPALDNKPDNLPTIRQSDLQKWIDLGMPEEVEVEMCVGDNDWSPKIKTTKQNEVILVFKDIKPIIQEVKNQMQNDYLNQQQPVKTAEEIEIDLLDIIDEELGIVEGIISNRFGCVSRLKGYILNNQFQPKQVSEEEIIKAAEKYCTQLQKGVVNKYHHFLNGINWYKNQIK